MKKEIEQYIDEHYLNYFFLGRVRGVDEYDLAMSEDKKKLDDRVAQFMKAHKEYRGLMLDMVFRAFEMADEEVYQEFLEAVKSVKRKRYINIKNKRLKLYEQKTYQDTTDTYGGR